jgi:4-alpha-glucanotransferase
MSNPIQLCLVLHNHQPIGNFEGVFEQAYQQSYRPFLDIFEEFPSLKISLHTSGPLMLWLEKNHPEYVHRLARLAASGSVEILGGPMFEPILSMLPSRDRIGQILAYSDYLSDLLQTEIRGMWVPERVWESSLTSDLARAGMHYTVLDDYHFLTAGLKPESLTGSFLTEEDGFLLRVFPGSEALRYLIPFAEVNQTIELARNLAAQNPDSLLVFADDGEKFGSWPDTFGHVYERNWLRNFFSALDANASWLRTVTLGDATRQQPPVGKVYLPECSYREMTEWALPSSQQQAYQDLVHRLETHPDWPLIRQRLRAGNWRNFRVKYSESNEMYCRMMQVSRKLQSLRTRCGDADLIASIENHLYRGQCNCPYWHGAFGGIYLPHLRNAIYHELIEADNRLDAVEHGNGQWVEATCEDYNLDQFNEVRLANDQLIAYFAPASGGMMYELDFRAARHNLLATMQRRMEPYHGKIAQSQTHDCQESTEVASIHDRVVCKQSGLEQRLQTDPHPRKSLLEHFFDNDVQLDSVAAGEAMERGDFVSAAFDAKLRRATNRMQLQFSREGNAWGIPLKITKAVTLEAGSSALEIAYLIEGLPQDRQLHLALEWNFAGLPADVDDRFYYDAAGKRLGHLGSRLDLSDLSQFGLFDQWQGIDVSLEFSRPSNLWTFPIATVSQSEGGFELVHQSVCVMPHWLIQGERDGTWKLQMTMNVSLRKQPTILAPTTIQLLSPQLQ